MSATGSPATKTEGFRVPPGPSILESLWGLLMIEMGNLMATKEPGYTGTEEMRFRLEGLCGGIAQSIAIILNPYDPNINEVRREAMRRYRGGL